MTQDWLARHLCVNKSSVTRHLTKLEQKGYIERRVCEEDKRELLVYPTEKMLAIRDEVARITKEWNALLFEGLTEDEMRIFDEIMEKLTDKSMEIIYGEKPSNENNS